MSEGHFRDDGQHDLLAFGGVRVFPVLAKPSFQSGCGVPGSILAVSWVSIRVRAQGSSVRMIPYRSGHACRVVIRRALQGAKPMVLLAKDHFMETCAQCRIGYRSLTQTHHKQTHSRAHTCMPHVHTLNLINQNSKAQGRGATHSII